MREAWRGKVWLNNTPSWRCVCTWDRKSQPVQKVFHNLCPSFRVHHECHSEQCTPAFNNFSLFVFSVLRRNILWTGLRWATVLSTSSTGWTGRSWLWAWLISCRPVYLLSTCTTTQNMPHCHWGPTLLSGQPFCLLSKIEKHPVMRWICLHSHKKPGKRSLYTKILQSRKVTKELQLVGIIKTE